MPPKELSFLTFFGTENTDKIFYVSWEGLGCEALPFKLPLLLNPQSVLGGEGGKIAHGHERAFVPQVDLQSLRVADLPQTLYGVRVPQEVR